MGIAIHLECNECKYKFKLYSLVGFRYKNDTEKEFFELSPYRENSIKSGVDGIGAKIYCISCNEISEIVLLEYKHRIYDEEELFDNKTELKEGYSMELYKKILKNNISGYFNTETPKISKNNSKQVCPKCGKRNSLILAIHNMGKGIEFKCSKCVNGKIKVTRMDHYISK